MNLIKRYITQNPYFSDGRYLTDSGFDGFFLHSVGCNQPDPLVFLRGWDNAAHTNAGINGFIGAEAVYITAPCLESVGTVKRMPHAGRPANDHYIGFEMTEPKQLRYNQNATAFTVPEAELESARSFAAATYCNAVELFAALCLFHGKDPLADGVILSHREGAKRGIATNHGDPETVWNGLNMPYTMDGFRADVKSKMEENEMTRDECNALITQAVAPLNAQIAALKNRLTEKENELQQLQTGIGFHSERISALCELVGMQSTEILQCTALTEAQRTALEALNDGIDERIQTALNAALGPMIGHLEDAPKWMRPALRELLEFGVINGGTPAEVDPLDVNKRQAILEAVLMAKKCAERYADALLLPTLDENGEATA